MNSSAETKDVLAALHEAWGQSIRRFWCDYCGDEYDVTGYTTNGQWEATPNEAVCCPGCGERGECDE